MCTDHCCAAEQLGLISWWLLDGAVRQWLPVIFVHSTGIYNYTENVWNLSISCGYLAAALVKGCDLHNIQATLGLSDLHNIRVIFDHYGLSFVSWYSFCKLDVTPSRMDFLLPFASPSREIVLPEADTIVAFIFLQFAPNLTTMCMSKRIFGP